MKSNIIHSAHQSKFNPNGETRGVGLIVDLDYNRSQKTDKSKPQHRTLNYANQRRFYVKCFIWGAFFFREPVSRSVCLYKSVCCRTAAVAGFIHHDKPADSATVTHNHTSLQLAGPQSENEWQFIDMKTSYIFVPFPPLLPAPVFTWKVFFCREERHNTLTNGGFGDASAQRLFRCHALNAYSAM